LRRHTKILPAVTLAILLGIAFQIRVGILNRSGWGIDFDQFYSAGRLTGTGHLYEWDALRNLEAEHGHEVPTGRLPVVLYGHKLLARLPYGAAQIVWMTLCIAALAVFAITWPGASRSLMMVALAWSMPVTLILLFGQDTPFWLMFFAAALLLMERKKPWSAGFAFSLCICKFHLALGIPVMLVAQKRWKTLIAGAVSVLVLLALCFLIEGPQWPLRYAKMAQMAAFAPRSEVMPTISAIAARLPWPAAAEIAGAIAIMLLLWEVCRRMVDPGLAGAAAAACGLLVAHHALFADAVLLIPLAVLTLQRQNIPFWLKGWALLMLSPVPFLLAYAWEKPLVWQALIAPFVIAAVLALWSSESSVPAPFTESRRQAKSPAPHAIRSG
jgi:hypothetical protein